MTERELLRVAASRLAIIRYVEKVTGYVALTCRYYGISRTLFHMWRDEERSSKVLRIPQRQC